MWLFVSDQIPRRELSEVVPIEVLSLIIQSVVALAQKFGADARVILEEGSLHQISKTRVVRHGGSLSSTLRRPRLELERDLSGSSTARPIFTL
jgi:hypothetical protein